MKSPRLHIVTLLIALLGCSVISYANNIVVSGISLTTRNTSTQTVRVNFNLSWDNSWRTTSAPFNWDAAWVFVKYKVGATGEWKHATLATTGHTIPSGAASTQNDATGIFVYRNATGTGTFSPTGIQLQWNYGSDGVSNEAKIFVRVFAIEMVYHPPGGFQAGSGAINNGEFRRANDVTATAPASTFTITGTNPTLQGNNSASSPTNLGAYNNTSTDLSGTGTATLASGFPTGFNSFYAMKYEISQQQYVDFLNTLTYTQQAARTIAESPPNSAAGTGALIQPNANRNGIDIQTPGTASTVPAVYACNLDGDGNYNEADDGQKIACNYLSWDDVAAFLDWAALRPLTELEYEKAARGTNTPVANEFAWGNTTANAVAGLSNAGLTNELASTTSNIAYNNTFTSGPIRVGMFATNGSDRANSGAGYYGAMELSGNLWERCITAGNSTGRNFNGAHGNGTLTTGGAADASGWPAAGGAGLKGGGWQSNSLNTSISGRQAASNGDNTRQSDYGGRGARTDPTGIVTDGLVLWLDAGITSSYPTSGTTWTDLSGNRNNGTLTNGPTYSSANGGSILFNSSNKKVIIPYNSNINPSNVTISVWFKRNSTINYSHFAGLPAFNSSWTAPYVSYGIEFIGTTDQPSLVLGFSGGSFSYTTANASTSTAVGLWVNVVGTFDGSFSRIYVNGQLITSNVETRTLFTTSANFVLGTETQGTNSYSFNGNISNTQVYNRALSVGEVLQNFNALKSRFGL
jgi:formylglycine-generating enzyme required for sulfatase activity